MQGSSTREDDDDGWRRRHSEGWVGSWTVDRSKAWRGGFDRDGALVVWQGTTVTLSLRRTYVVCLIIELKSWTACYHQIDQVPHVVRPRGCGPCRMEREVEGEQRTDAAHASARRGRGRDVVEGDVVPLTWLLLNLDGR